MKNFILLFALLALSFSLEAFGQVPISSLVKIVKAEDARRFDGDLQDLLRSPDAKIRARAALAAGRIGNDAAVPALASLLQSDSSEDVRAMAAFAMGEIESSKAAEPILRVLRETGTANAVRARAVETAGKIAAANATDEKTKGLGEAILYVLRAEDAKGSKSDRDIVLLAITAILRARPVEADVVVAKYLTNLDGRIRADAANTLARLRSKNANDALRAMLLSDNDAVARANAARALGAAEDKTSLDALIEAAVEDDDLRVRVSATRALATLKEAKAGERLLDRGVTLFADYKRSKYANPVERNELLEIATALGRVLANSRNERAVNFLKEFAAADNGRNPEISIARVRVAPADIRDRSRTLTDWHQYRTWAEIAAEYAAIEPTTEELKNIKQQAPEMMKPILVAFLSGDRLPPKLNVIVAPDILRSYAKFKTPDLPGVLRQAVVSDDVFLRAAAAELLAELPSTEENIGSLKAAWNASNEKKYEYDDDLLAILDSLYKLDKKVALPTLTDALNSDDYVVRKKAFELLRAMQKEHPGVSDSLEKALRERRDQVFPYSRSSQTKLGQLLNTDADYRRAVSRKNGSVKAAVTTAKGIFTIDLLPEDAPLTVDNFIKLAKANYFNGIEVHRVVPNFVIQDGDPRGDGNGGPGWSIRCEINMVPYGRGAVGMALSGKDTGGSQWFVTHSPQPHLDGGYTVFGRVNGRDMRVVDNIVRGDKILTVKIIESSNTQRRMAAR